MHRRGWTIGAVVMSTVLLLAACGSSSTSTSPAGGTSSTSTSSASTSTSSSSASSDGAPVNVTGKSSIKMEADSYLFTPATLEGSAGQKLTITLDNEASIPHNFSIDDENISVTLQGGQEKDIQVTFPESGSVQFYCAFHESRGMVGTLEVR
jgi:plastocyanin